MAIRESRIGSEANPFRAPNLERFVVARRDYVPARSSPPASTKRGPHPRLIPSRVFDAQLDANRSMQEPCQPAAWFDIALARFLRAVCKKRAMYRRAARPRRYGRRYAAKSLNLFTLYRLYRLYR